MKVASFVKATAFFTAAAFAASVGVADAQVVDKDNAKCRATANKNASKVAATASKGIVGCWKTALKNFSLPADCNDAVAADSLKPKLTKTTDKLLAAVDGGAKSKCTDADHADSLAAYADCPSPGTQGVGMTSFSQVAPCLNEVAVGMVTNMHRSAMNPGANELAAIAASPNAKDIAKCGNAIQKNFSKLIATVGKSKGKEQATLDKNGGPYEYDAFGPDGKGKVQKTIDKLVAGVDKACSVLSGNDFGLLRTCGESVAEAGACLAEIADNGSTGVTAISFEMPGVCPSQVTVIAKPRADGATATKLDAGWTGAGHSGDILDFTGRVNLACSDNTCSSCAVTTSCDEGNCRCSNDVSVQCDEPFANDGDDCGGALCEVLFGAPLPLTASGTPTCIVTKIDQELVGTADVGTGASSTFVDNSSVVHTGISQTQPCPECVGGVCSDGPRVGLSCTPSENPTFPDTSFDCPPDPGTNVSGSGIDIQLTFSDAPADLTAQVPCSLVGALDCHCQQCSGDNSVGCNSDADCAAVGAGTCSANTGAGNLPNGCSDGTCTVDADGNGECLAGPVQGFCNGFTKPDGSGLITCSSNADCTPLAAGDCDIFQNQKCFGGTISLEGTYGAQDGAVLGSNFCIPPTASAAINGAAGSPGPGSLRIAWDFDGLCSDGSTEYILGGGNCP